VSSEEGTTITLAVVGIVSNRDKQPYVQLLNGEQIVVQLSMAQTRQVAMDMLIMASRTECDGMIFDFCEQNGLGFEAAGSMMLMFRDYRAKYDREQPERPPDQEGGLPPRQV
jgi:hypothetical protein